MSDRSAVADAAFNVSLPPPSCLSLRRSMLIFTTFAVTNTLFVLPLSALIFCLGYRRWRQRRSQAISHSDIFTYHMMAMEVVAVVGCLFYYVCLNTDLEDVSIYGFYTFLSLWCTKVHFQALTCVEHYLAVVHPVAYLRLKTAGGIRVRNLSVGCVWLLCLMWWVLVSQAALVLSMTVHVCLAASALIVVCFCCVSVLCALRRPTAQDSAHAGQIRRRTFNSVVTIMAVLWLCLGSMLLVNVLVNWQLLSHEDGCDVIMASFWLSLPSSWVLPSLYLNRAGKLGGSSAAPAPPPTRAFC